VSLDRCHSLDCVRRREPRQLYSHVEIDTLCRFACLNVLMSFFAPRLVAHGPLSPLMISPERCNTPPVQRSPSLLFHLVGFFLLSLIGITLQVLLSPMVEVTLEVDDLKGRSTLASNGWMLFLSVLKTLLKVK